MAVHTFPKLWTPKMKAVAQLEFKLAYCDFTLKYFSHYPIYQTPPLRQDMTQGQFLSGV